MRARTPFLASAILGLLAGTAHAAPAAPAPVSDLVARVAIPYTKFQLENGLTVLVHTDRKAPIVAVSVWYDVGSKHEPKGKTGYAHLFEHIMFNGSENAPDDYFTYTKSIGATDLNGTTWFDRTNYFETVPNSALESALFLESDRMGRLLGAVTQDKLTNQIGVVSNEKRQGDNAPYGMVEYAQLGALYPDGHPYHHSTIGSLADLRAASLDDIRGWFRDHYGPNNSILVLAGDIDVGEAKALTQKWFGKLPAGPKVAKVAAPLPALAKNLRIDMKDQVPTTRIYRNWVVPGINDKDYNALTVGASVLGGLATSRLDKQLVRAEQVAVGVTASVEGHVEGSKFEMTADVKPGGDADAVKARMDAVLAELIAKGPTEDEVRRVATSVAATQIAGLEQVGGFGGKAVALAEGQLYSGDPDHYRKELAELAAMTPAKVQAAMKRWLSKPSLEIRVTPGERGAYDEETAVAPAAPAAAPAAPAEAAPAAATAPKVAMPAVGATPEIDYPAVEQATLSNGIKVYFARRTAVPTVQVAVSLDAGYAADPRDALGTVGLTTRMLSEGTRTRTALQLLEEEERLGATIAAGSTLDRTTVTARAVTPNLGATLDLLADVVKNPAFDARELERVRVQQLTAIQAELSDPQEIALRAILPTLYGPAHPYAVPYRGTGDAEAVKRLQSSDLAGFHARWFRPEKTTIFAVGDTTLSALTPQLESRFGTWRGTGTGAPAKALDAAVPQQTPRIILIDRPGSPQSVILAGIVTKARGRDDFLPINAGNDVLGGDFLSRINTDLRETKGWSYGSFSFLNRAEGNVPFLLNAPVQADKTGPALQVAIDQVKAFFGPDGVTAIERDRTVKGNTLELAGNYELSGAVLGQMQADVLYGRPLDYVKSLSSRYAALTPATMTDAVKRIFDPAQLIWVVVGDARQVRPQLAAIGLPIEERGASPAPVAKPN